MKRDRRGVVSIMGEIVLEEIRGGGGLLYVLVL